VYLKNPTRSLKYWNSSRCGLETSAYNGARMEVSSLLQLTFPWTSSRLLSLPLPAPVAPSSQVRLACISQLLSLSVCLSGSRSFSFPKSKLFSYGLSRCISLYFLLCRLTSFSGLRYYHLKLSIANILLTLAFRLLEVGVMLANWWCGGKTARRMRFRSPRTSRHKPVPCTIPPTTPFDAQGKISCYRIGILRQSKGLNNTQI
jgi:hypothetical protein